MAERSASMFACAVSWALSGSARADECLAPASLAEVDGALARAESAWVASDQDDFEIAAQELSAFLVPCLAESASADAAARVHRVRALLAFQSRDPDLARLSLLAARRVAPTLAAEPLLPLGEPLRITWDHALDTPAEPAVRLPKPAGGALLFDGVVGRERPTDVPTLVQLRVDGAVVRTTWLRPEEPMFRYRRDRTLPIALGVTSGVSALTFAGLFGASSATSARYYATDGSDDAALDRLRAQTNGMYVGGIVAGGTSLVTGIVAAVLAAR